MSYTELCFTLPAARDLWKASSAEEWQAMYLSRRPLSPEKRIPRVSEVMHEMSFLDNIEDIVDVELTYTALLHGYWGQVLAYREAVKF
jgi:hypothetical protein